MVRMVVRGSTVFANGDLGAITDGALIIEDGVIIDVGPRRRIESKVPSTTN